MLRLRRARLALRVVQRPLVERRDRLPRLLDHLLAQLDGLGQDDLLLSRQQRDLTDLLEIHPDRVVDADHVGADGLEVLGRRLLDLFRVELGRTLRRKARGRCVDGVLGDDFDAHLAFGLRLSLPDGGELEILVIVVVFFVVGLGDGDGCTPWAKSGELRLFDIGLGAAGPRQDGFDELLIERICWHPSLLAGQVWAATTGRASSRVCSRRRSIERRLSLIWRCSRCRRSTVTVSPVRSASASAVSRYSLRSRIPSSSMSRSNPATSRASGGGFWIAITACASERTSSSGRPATKALRSNAGWMP